jgi:hypothetical protein
VSGVSLRPKTVQLVGEVFNPPSFWSARFSQHASMGPANATYLLVGTLLNDESSLQSSFLVTHREQGAGKVFFASHASWKERSASRSWWRYRRKVSEVALSPGDTLCNYSSVNKAPERRPTAAHVRGIVRWMSYLLALPVGSDAVA